jgi:L-ascorbate metabolism protein UlaG (beta-lactamase superfamily)
VGVCSGGRVRGDVGAGAPLEPPGFVRPLRDPMGGFVLTVVGGLRVYHAGASVDGPFFASIGARSPGIDVAMPPIGAYASR